MRSTIENCSASRADQVSPACWRAAFFRIFLDGLMVLHHTFFRDREEVAREANLVERVHFVLDVRSRRCACSNRPQAVGWFCSVAQRTFERSPEPGITPGGVHRPFSNLERWAMANVLAMSARELSNPIALVVLVVSADRSQHEFTVPKWSEESSDESGDSSCS